MTSDETIISGDIQLNIDLKKTSQYTGVFISYNVRIETAIPYFLNGKLTLINTCCRADADNYLFRLHCRGLDLIFEK